MMIYTLLANYSAKTGPGIKRADKVITSPLAIISVYTRFCFVFSNIGIVKKIIPNTITCNIIYLMKLKIYSKVLGVLINAVGYTLSSFTQ